MRKFEELLVSKGLYDCVNITVDDLDEMEQFLSNKIYKSFNIDCFCIDCNEKRVFDLVDKKSYEEQAFLGIPFGVDVGQKVKPSKMALYQEYLNKRYCISFCCTREHKHSLLFDLLITNDKIIKIGQYPSFADISIGDTTKYKNVLADKYREYCTSLGLFSHGVGIGSFVYLRRIIEKLVFEKYYEVSNKIDIDKKTFIHSDFKERIDILKDYLPKVLVDNKNIYSIISKGVHELEEKECVNMFPYVKAGIELILDDILLKKEREEKEKLFSKFVSDKTGELRKI